MLGEVLGDPVKGLEPEGLADGLAQVGIGVDVVEDQAAIGGFEILDAGDVEAPGGNDAFPGGDSSGGHFRVGVKLDGFGGGQGEVFLEQQKVVGQPEIGLVAQEGMEFAGFVPAEDAGAAAALFGLDEGRRWRGCRGGWLVRSCGVRG